MPDAVENTPELSKCGWMPCVPNTRRAQTPWAIEGTECGENSDKSVHLFSGVANLPARRSNTFHREEAFGCS